MSKQDNSQYMVCVKCFTFNHAKYIRNTLLGFCIQQTDFPFVCAIVDDASTDSAQEVIKTFIEENFDINDKSMVKNEDNDDYSLTFVRHKRNKNCFFAMIYLKYNHYSIKKKQAVICRRVVDKIKIYCMVRR